MSITVSASGSMLITNPDGSHDTRTVSCGSSIERGDVGSRRCGLPFNPSDHSGVTRIKVLAAALMNAIEDERAKLDEDPHNDGFRCMATAMTHIEAGQMFAVKGLFAARNAEK